MIKQQHSLFQHKEQVTFEVFFLYNRVAPCSQLPVPTGSAQLVLAATAAHWFDPIEDFYSEAERVLCPGGTLVLCGYCAPQFDAVFHKNHQELNRMQARVGW